MAVMESTSRSKYFVIFILFMIGLGFALSTCDNIKPSDSTNVATVNGEEIGIEQFQRALQQFGLGELTQKQLKQLNFGKTIIDQLVSAELLKQWGSELGFAPSKEEIAEEIKRLPYFLDDKKQFDITRYKSILAANKLTPQGFEDSISSEIIMRHASISAAWSPISTNEAKLNFMLKNTGTKVAIVKIKPVNLKPLIQVSNEEVKNFLNDSKNFTILNNLYERNKHLYVSPESYKVREVSASFENEEEKKIILSSMQELKSSNSANDFTAKAEKFIKISPEKRSHVEHGWLTQENMVFSPEIKNQIIAAKKNQILGPEINDAQIVYYIVEDILAPKNISLDNAKQDLAANYLRDQNSKALEVLSNEWQEKIKKLLASNNFSQLKALNKSLALEIQEDVTINKTEKTLTGSIVDSNQLKQIYNSSPSEVLSFKSLSVIILVKIKGHVRENDPTIAERWNKENVDFQQELERQTGTAQLQQITKVLTNKARIWKNENLF